MDYLKPVAVHDMAVTNVYTVPASPYVEQSTTIHVTVKNKGDQQEKDVPVKAYVDGYQVGSTQHVTLTDGRSTTKSFSWTPSTAKTYSVKGEVGIVSGETDTSDNTKTINVVVSTQPVGIPKLSIPVYTPYQQQAHKGTELRYTINVTNEGTITDTIDLDVAENTQDWDLQLSETSVTLAPGESTYVYLYLTIEEVGARNKITIRGTSQGDSSKISECSGIRAENLLDGYGLFAAILIFKKDPQERTLSLNVPDYVKISATEIKLDPSAQKTVNVLFDPTPSESDISTIDIDVTVITDTTTGESATIPIKFPEYEIIATNFDMATDSYSFPNWAKWTFNIKGYDFALYGYCSGMSWTSILYFGDLITRPNNVPNTYSLKKEDAETINTIKLYNWQFYKLVNILHLLLPNSPFDKDKQYNELETNINGGYPMLFVTYGHVVVAYKIVRDADKAYIFVYDNEKEYLYDISKNDFYNAFPYATYDFKSHEFNYKSDSSFLAVKADAGLLHLFIGKEFLLRFMCPVNITIADQYGRHISDDGTNDIPDAILITANEQKLFYLPAELTYLVNITAYGSGEFTTETVCPFGDNTVSLNVYDNISITENTHATLDLAANEVNPMNIDYDGDGTIDEEKYPDVSETIEINQPPNAAFTYSPPHPIVNQSITFNASSSYDPDGNITNYKWNFGDGNITNTTDPLITHTYVSAGDYTVNLTVTDDEGEYSYTESSITIKEPDFYVPDDYPSIQAAVDAASAGDTIIARDGAYTENVDIDKSITLKSSSGNPEYTIVDAVDFYNPVFSVTADHVKISGFTVTEARVYGIYLHNADYCDISDNICSHSIFGIYLEGSNSNSIADNTCINNVWMGICLNSSTKNSISNNTCSNNGHDGICLACSTKNSISNNTCSNSGYGIVLEGCNQNSISNNLCSNNELGIGIYPCWGSNNNCSYLNNCIYLNNFINNDCNAYSHSSTDTWYSPVKLSYTYNGESHTNYLGNYWSDYTGTDANKNGIGDSPYSIDTDQDDYPLMTWSEHYFIYPPHPIPTLPTPPPTSTLTPAPRPTVTLAPRPTVTLAPPPTLTPTPRPTLRPTATLFEKIEGLIAAIRVGAGI